MIDFNSPIFVGAGFDSPMGMFTDLFEPKGSWTLEHFNKKGELLGKYELFPNGITTAGKNYILGAGFHADSQVTTWYAALIDNSGFSALSASDTMASHAGWTEFTTYSQSTHVQWTCGSPSGASITNASVMTFDITGSGTLYGIYITSASAKSATTGTLWSTAAFPSTVPVSNGDSLKLTYTVNA